MGLALSLCLKADTTVCVCPKNAVHTVWADTLKERFKEVPKYWTSLDGTEPPKGMNYYIVHYDYLVKFLNSINKLNIHNPVILLDESHNFNDIKSMRVELFINLCNVSKSENVLWESGTPVKALGGELATLFATIDPFFNDDAQKRFSAIYGKASNVANDILAARMGMVTFKVSSSAVVEGEPIINRINVKIPNGKKYTLDNIREEMRDFIKKRVEYYSTNMQNFEKRYNEILNFYYRTLHRSSDKEEFKKYLSFVKLIRDNYDPVAMKEEVLFCNNYEKNKIIPTLPKEMKNDFKNLKSIIKYYRLKIQGEALGQILGKKRAQCIVDMIPYIGMEDVIDTAIKKTLIFTSYVSAVDACDTYLRKSGYKPILIYGKTNNELAGNVAIFEKDDDINPMIATYASLSSAVPLTMANQMFMLDSPFRSYERDQAIARTHRMGQDQQVYVTDVFLDTDDQPNISTRSKDILDWSRIQVNEILNFKNNGLVLDNELVFENSNNSIATDIAMELVLEEFESLNITLEQEYNYTEQSTIHKPAWTNW
jgi:SNF2 family DNA or RNA helicase